MSSLQYCVCSIMVWSTLIYFKITTALVLCFILHDRVEFSDPPFLNGTQRTVNSSGEQEFIDNLHPGVMYNFTVEAFNEIGFGLESEALPVNTLEEGTISLYSKRQKALIYWIFTNFQYFIDRSNIGRQNSIQVLSCNIIIQCFWSLVYTSKKDSVKILFI